MLAGFIRYAYYRGTFLDTLSGLITDSRTSQRIMEGQCNVLLINLLLANMKHIHYSVAI